MQLPHKFGKYVLLEKIASGGMAEIYRAKYYAERGFAKEVAVKRILPNWTRDKNFERMLIDEAKALVHLQHQNIVQVFELGRDGDCYYISMEYVDGVNLKDVYEEVERENRGLPEKFACFIIAEVLKALEFAHRQRGEGGEYLNIVHRDVSPQNILLSMNGEVKLTDFGIAKGLHRVEETTTNQLKGKYAYMSPEQAMGNPLDHRSDLYSAAIVLYEILTGSRLFRSADDFETIRNVRESRFPDGWEARVSLNMRRILKKALAKAPDKRYQSAAEFLKDVSDYVALKKLHTHGLELADYLCQVLPSRPEPAKDFVAEESRRTKILGRKAVGVVGGRYAILTALFVPLLLAATLKSESGGKHPITKNEWQVAGVGRVVSGPRMPSIGSGVISIDTEPSGAAGVLEYDGMKKDFTTPFIIADINVKKGVETKLMLSKSGFKTIEDSWSLSKESPSFSKVYKLESTAPAVLSVQARPWGYVSIPGVLENREAPLSGVKIKPGRYQVKVYYSPTDVWARADLVAKAGGTYKCLADFAEGAVMWCN